MKSIKTDDSLQSSLVLKRHIKKETKFISNIRALIIVFILTIGLFLVIQLGNKYGIVFEAMAWLGISAFSVCFGILFPQSRRKRTDELLITLAKQEMNENISFLIENIDICPIQVQH